MVFEKAEYLDRIARARAAMERAGIEVLVESDPANMNWLTGYDGWSFYNPQAIILALDGEPLWVGRGLDVNGAHATVFMMRENILGFPEDLFERKDRHPMQFFAAEMARRGWGNKRIGIAKDTQQFTTRMRESLVAAMPNAKFVDSDGVVNWLRLVKSPGEIALMRDASRITERIMARFFELVRPGARECDVAAEVWKAHTEGTPEFAGDYPASIPFFAAGPNTATTHLTWSERRFTASETVCLQTGGARHRYHSPMARTMQLGAPPKRLAELNGIVLEGMDVVLSAARAGRTCESVEAAWRGVIERRGLKKESRIGYPVGVGYPPDWGERTASFRPGDTTVLRPGMTFHVFLGMWMDDWGISISETILVSDKGSEPLANVPRPLYVKT
jgi:ectoine hydrolase